MPKKRPATGSAAKVNNQLTNLKSPELASYWLSALIDSADDAIISKTLEGIITSWNAGAQRIFGYTADEVIGKHVTILIPEDHIDEEPTILSRLRAGDRIEHYETVRRHKDGTLLDISLTVSPIFGPGGRIVGASKIARNITEQRRAQRALNEAAERLNPAPPAAPPPPPGPPGAPPPRAPRRAPRRLELGRCHRRGHALRDRRGDFRR